MSALLAGVAALGLRPCRVSVRSGRLTADYGIGWLRRRYRIGMAMKKLPETIFRPKDAGYPKRQASNLVVAQEKLAAPGWQSLFDQALDEVRHVGGAM